MGADAAHAQALGSDIPVGLLFLLTGSVAVVEHTLHDESLRPLEEINAAGGIRFVLSLKIPHLIRTISNAITRV